MIRRELGIWKRLSHPNIVPFLGIVSGFGRLGNVALVSSWMPNGTLQDFLLKYDDKLKVADRLQLLLGVTSGLEYLHSLSIVHGDLTCNSVLLDDKHNARLTDFGYASLVGEIPEALAYLQASTVRPGTVRWAAPEYFSNPEEAFHCTIKSDIYSFGSVALQVLSGKPPWSEFRRNAVVVLHLAKGHKPRRPQSHPIDDQHWEFIEHCWSPVRERPSAKYLASSILDFLRSYPHPQLFCSMLVSSEKSNSQSALSGLLLSPSSMDEFSPLVPLGERTLSPPRRAQSPPSTAHSSR
ncbi:kinase-like protein [Imleria badia]|nr:kinase-like protein [Imleria badia]